MDLQALKTELSAGHPGTGPYSADDAEAARQLNAVNRTKPNPVISPMQLLERFDKAEYKSVVQDSTNPWKGTVIGHLFTINEIKPGDDNVQDAILAIFGSGSKTLKNLTGAAGGDFPGDDLRVVPGSRAEEISLGIVTPSHVAKARRLP